MTSRERDFSTAVAAATKTTEIRGSKFRREAGDFEERQIPRRFGFGKSPSRHHSSGAAMIYERASPPQNSHYDTPRHTTILPPSASPLGRRMVSNDVRAVQNAVAVEDRQHSVFSQLALVLGFDLAKQVTQRHPHELDLNRLANLALDIATQPHAAASASAATSSRSASTTSQTSTQSQERRRSGGSINRSSEGTRRFGRGRALSFGRSRANSNPTAADDAFVSAVYAATAVASASPSPPRMAVVNDDADVCTDATAADDEGDLIDWEGEAEEVLPSTSTPLVVESSHLLD